MQSLPEIFHYQQSILQCDDGSCCGGDICSVQVDVVADGVNLSSKQTPPHGGVDFAVPAGTTVTITATPMMAGGVPSGSFTREFSPGEEIPGDSSIFGDLTIRKKVAIAE